MARRPKYLLIFIFLAFLGCQHQPATVLEVAESDKVVDELELRSLEASRSAIAELSSSQDGDVRDEPRQSAFPITEQEVDTTYDVNSETTSEEAQVATGSQAARGAKVGSRAQVGIKVDVIGSSESSASNVQPAEPTSIGKRPWSADVEELRQDIQNCLAYFAERPENIAQMMPWDLMHATLAFGSETQFVANDKRINGLDWLCENGAGHGMRLLTVEGQDVVAKNGRGYQGHAGQFLAILTQCGISSDHQLKVDEQQFTVDDLINYEMKTCEPKTELTFKLIAFSNYLDGNATWDNEFGAWDLTRLLKEELDQGIRGASCGGTHRLTGISHALKQRRKRGEAVEGEWARAEELLAKHIAMVFDIQIDDGSFSTSWFNLQKDSSDLNRELWVSGHLLEWLAYELPDEKLDDPHVVAAVRYLSDLMLENRDFQFAVGKKYHALHALAMLNRRYYESSISSLELAESELPKLKSNSAATKVATRQIPTLTRQHSTPAPTYRPRFRRRFFRQ